MTEENTPKTGWQPGDAVSEPEKKPIANVKVEVNVEQAPATEAENAPVVEVKATEQPQPSAQGEPASQPKAEPQPQAQSTPAPSVQTAPSSVVNPSVVVYEKGCCGAAWEDVRNTKGWFGKVCLMALVEFIPILNWVNKGFALRWSRQLSLGKVEGMPQKLFCKRAFGNGAMTFLISLVVGVVTAIAVLVLGWIPLIGALAGICLTIFVQMIMNFCYVRMAIFDELGEGFAINKGFECLKRQFGKAFCIEFMPGLIFGVIIVCICMIAGTLFLVVNGAALYSDILSIINQYSSIRSFEYAFQYDTHVQMQILAIVLKSFAVCVPWLIITGFFINICNMLSMLVETRAAGHFVARYCSDWQNEPKFNVVLQCEEE